VALLWQIHIIRVRVREFKLQLTWQCQITQDYNTLVCRNILLNITYECNLCKFKELCIFPSVALLWQVSQLRFHRLFIEKYYKLPEKPLQTLNNTPYFYFSHKNCNLLDWLYANMRLMEDVSLTSKTRDGCI